MNKIGILTHHSVYNFGANLQALSTQEYLRKKGFDAYIINWIPQDLHKYYINSTPFEQCEAHESFFKKYYRLTDECHSSKEVASILDKNNFDAVIIGSDAVTRHFPFSYRYSIGRKGFRKNYLNSTDYFPNPYWGAFYPYLKHKIPMAMMSVSSQGTNWLDIGRIEKTKIKNRLKEFSYISVRDSFTRNAFSFITDEEIVPDITPDPVFSFNYNVDFLGRDHNIQEDYVIFSFKKETLPPIDWLLQLKKMFNKNGYKVYSLPYPQEECDFEVDKKVSLPLNPLEWYNIIKNSKAYIGNNMHPVVVALHNSIPVFSFDYYAVRRNKYSLPNIQMSKIYDLFKFADLKDSYFNVQFGYDEIPDCAYVVDRILSTNRIKLQKFSTTMKENYDIMFNNMISCLEKQK